MSRNRMWLLVTGQGRCGTGYVAHVLSSAGVMCTHEKVFNLRGWEWAQEQIGLRALYPEWGWQADSSWLAMPYLGKPSVQDMTVVHLVRHPRNVIRSLARIQNWTATRYERGQSFLYKHMPELLEYDDPNERSAFFWTEWNKRIRPFADITHRIEDDVRGLLDTLDIEYNEADLYDNTHYNTRAFVPEQQFELGDLSPELWDMVADEMSLYGYYPGDHEPTRYELAERVQCA